MAVSSGPQTMGGGDGTERSFLGLRDLDTAGKLATKRHDTEQMRNILKREWALNREYFNGNQWSFW